MPPKDIFDVLLEDHQEIRELLHEVIELSPDRRAERFREAVVRLARHETAEQAIVHPTTREHVPDGDEIMQTVVTDENQIEDMLAQMEDMDPTSDRFLESARALRDTVVSHAGEEESQEWPALRDSLDLEHQRSMADAFERFESVAPTHPHPDTATTDPELRAVLGPVAGVFDRARDAARELTST